MNQTHQLFIERNAIESERLRQICYRLRREDMERNIAPGWTVATTLAHIAFWDRQVLAVLEALAKPYSRGEDIDSLIADTGVNWLPDTALRLWERVGVRAQEVFDMDVDELNETALPSWNGTTYEEIVQEALAAAELLDWKIKTLDAGFAERILATDKFWMLDPSGHRAAHIYTIEDLLEAKLGLVIPNPRPLPYKGRGAC